MIIDTSALVAILVGEEGDENLIQAVIAERGGIPAPVMLEFMRVARGQRFGLDREADDLVARLESRGCAILAFTRDHARIAVAAELRFGSGNGRGGTLNLLDLMVYAVAKDRGEPLLCTGKDFAATDLELHPASRAW